MTRGARVAAALLGLLLVSGCSEHRVATAAIGTVGPTPGSLGRVRPLGEGSCPRYAPIKATENGETGERWYFVPLSPRYGVVAPDWCFTTPRAAAAAGFRRAP